MLKRWYYVLKKYRKCLSFLSDPSRIIISLHARIELYFFFIIVDVRANLRVPRLIPRAPKVNDGVNLQWSWGDSNWWPLESKSKTGPTELLLRISQTVHIWGILKLMLAYKSKVLNSTWASTNTQLNSTQLVYIYYIKN